ncbi:MerR family transcriptional regulator [Vibrio maerlii]|uniref:MerR family transcriptional regulator n=1 Tax=Vibrio maerlii TaxID=2231648 RepID=UPI000E3BC345|nr:MerR family transcriptional regulator [Vibrio maerlii]
MAATYKISELAEQVGLSRTALLYYEKLNLITGTRFANGYRTYSDKDVQRVRLLQQLQSAGLTLKECKACLEAEIDRELLSQRLKSLDEEIEQKQRARNLLAAMLGEGDSKAWHESASQVAPDAHIEWLVKQGFEEKEALRLKWLSKDMNQHDAYMSDFMQVFETLDRWGPGSSEETLNALKAVPSHPHQILEIGCGKGLATTVLASNTDAHITVVDNEQSALDRLEQRFGELELADRLTSVAASMTELPFTDEKFDLAWAEGSAYIMGVTNALKEWRQVISTDGYLMLSDLVWLTDKPSDKVKVFFASEYPDMQTVNTRREQIGQAKYQLIADFTLTTEAWKNYYQPLKVRALELLQEKPQSQAIKDIITEVELYEQHLGEFGYQMFVMQKF